MVVLILMTFGVCGYLIITGGYQHRNQATLETVVVLKESGYQNTADMQSNKLTYVYSYVTFADNKPCEQVDDRFRAVKVRGEVHKCLSGIKEVSEAEWRNIRVGQVLKVVKLK